MDDLISRKAVRDGMMKYGFLAPDMTVHEFVEDELPSVPAVPLDKLKERDEAIAALQCALDKANEKLAYICGDECYQYDCEAGREQLEAWREAINATTSVQAVPLDKLCEWMALRFGYPCQIIDDCNAWYVSECPESEAKKADCWRRVLTTWMEELDDKQ